jgi:hypothetical protein
MRIREQRQLNPVSDEVLALTAVGLAVVDGPNPRADLLVTDGVRLGAVEAKGLEGPAKEPNLVQAEKWVTETKHALVLSQEARLADHDLRRYGEQLAALGVRLEATNVDCKGIMVIGTFRKTPLSQRTLADYPDQMLRPLKRSRICALTGLDLFTMLMSSRTNPTLKAGFVDMLFETDGPINLSLSWSQFLKGQT